MNKAKEIFTKAKTSYLTWVKARLSRRVFVWALGLALIMLLLSRIPTTSFLFLGAELCLCVALIASLMDTWTTYQIFIGQLKRLEHEHKIREVEAYGYVLNESCFCDQDQKEIKKRKSMFWGIMAFKVVFIIILIALAFNIGI